ncbi:MULTISPECIES: hypothetical protein [Streptomyces]|uniref:hypothetical protein n=1 Tax=Streptomyces TaxID=1883 RepID=UPI00163CDF3C|nr:hypothetical protein [Streptomyces sp. TYQ1024]
MARLDVHQGDHGQVRAEAGRRPGGHDGHGLARRHALDEAAARFGWPAPFAGLGSPASAALTRERLGWRPVHPSLLADLEEGHYWEA